MFITLTKYRVAKDEKQGLVQANSTKAANNIDLVFMLFYDITRLAWDATRGPTYITSIKSAKKDTNDATVNGLPW